MRRLRFFVVLLLLASSGANLLIPRTAHASTQDFQITNFTADYYLSRSLAQSSQMSVTESITAQFPEYDQNHGILRAIPKTYQKHTVSLEIDSVTTETGNPVRYSRSTENDNLVLKIGDPERYVHGSQTYIIKYHMSNVILFLPEHDELYWDVNGDAWPQAMDNVTARVHIPKNLQSSLLPQEACYTGAYGSKSKNCTITRQVGDNETVVTTAATQVGPFQTLTYVLGFNKGTFVLGPEIAAARRHQQMLWLIGGSLVLVPPLITLLVMLTRWRKYGRDPKGRGVIVAQYDPPKGFNVLNSAFILQERLPATAMSAAIIELAVQRYIDISEITTKKLLRDSKDYELKLLKNTQGLSAEQQRIITAFFKSSAAPGDVVKLSDLKYKLSADMKAIDKMIGTSLTTSGYFLMEPSKARTRYIGWGIGLAVFGFLIGFTGILLLLGIGLVLSGVVISLMSNLMPARSQTGVEIRDHLLGVKEFIKVVEEKRFQYLQSPEGAEKTGFKVDSKNPKQKVKLFEALLPYAMIFGLEKEWAKQFEGIYTESPDWYHGDYTTFRTAYLASAIGNMSSSSAQAFSSPSSSSSSGFGGGGFSGGGGGGGGGGGW